ncbi:aromatic acid exporter family protein [Streptomyces kebangsaanensis]|uniref:Aromatic acid exporter family protein n=1 Tax=Streptomyces kebangsaanensis TaxID=864058 RepID=A0ABW6KYE4_9ACTN
MHIRERSRRWLDTAARKVPPTRARVRADLWPILQQTLAATGAWLIARHLALHHQPFFAPVAAVVALNASRGERGTNAVRLLLGVVIGILTAELALTTLGNHGYGTLAFATFTAMLVALLLGGERIVLAQAAVSAILAVVTSNAEAGPQRLTDALIGSGVALVASQIVFSPEPIALLRRAETTALRALADALELAALVLRRTDHVVTGQEVLDRLRTAREELVELDQARGRSTHIVGRSLLWRRQAAYVLRESVSAAQLLLLGGSCLTLVRTAMAARSDTFGTGSVPAEADAVLALSRAVGELGRAPEDLDVRRAAAGIALGVLRGPAKPGHGTEHNTYVLAVRVAVRMVAVDVMVFAGVDKDKVAEAERAGWEQEKTMEDHVRTPVKSFLARLGGRRPSLGRPFRRGGRRPP